VNRRKRLATWAAAISVEASELHRQVCALSARAGTLNVPQPVIDALVAARQALCTAELESLTLSPQTTVYEEGDDD
jgi:hypothetical protein